MKKIIALLLALTLVVGTLAACGGSADNSSSSSTVSTSSADDTSSTAGDESEPEVSTPEATGEITYPLAETKTISWWHPLRAAEYESSHDNNIVWQKIAENVGVEIEWLHPATGTETEQLNMLLVSGDLPDIIQIDGYLQNTGGSSGGVNDGSFVDLTDYIAEYAPDYMRAITSSDRAYAMATTADGRVTEFDQIKQTAPQWNRVNVRNDIMKEIGWEDRLPETIDDYTEMFGAMKDKGYYGYKLDINGRDDQFMYAYGIGNGFYIQKDGSVAYGQYTDTYRDYLKQIRSWIEAGYVHPDWTSSEADPSAFFANKETGMYFMPSDIAYGLAKLNGYEISCVNYPRLVSGGEFRFEVASWDAVPADGIRTVVTTDCEERGNLEAALALLNYGYTEEGAELYNWGVEGVSFTRNSDGTKTFTDNILNNERIPMAQAQYIFKLHFGPKLAEPDVSCNPGTIADEHALYLRELYSDDTTVNSDGIIFATLTMEQSVARGDIMTDVETYMNESSLQFLLGEKDINDDAAWQAYKDTMQSMGIEDAIAITQEAVDQFNAKSIPTAWISK